MSGYMFTLMLSGKKLRPHDFSPRKKHEEIANNFSRPKLALAAPECLKMSTFVLQVTISIQSISIPHSTASLCVSICVLSIPYFVSHWFLHLVTLQISAMRSNHVKSRVPSHVTGRQPRSSHLSNKQGEMMCWLCWYGDSWTGLPGPFQSSNVYWSCWNLLRKPLGWFLGWLSPGGLQGLWGWIDPPGKMLWNDDTSLEKNGRNRKWVAQIWRVE